MSSLLIRISPPSTGADASAYISLRRTNPIWSIASIGAIFLVASLADDSLCPTKISLNEKSRMDLYLSNLWGIIASGDSFRSGGRLFLSSSHVIFLLPRPAFGKLRRPLILTYAVPAQLQPQVLHVSNIGQRQPGSPWPSIA